MIKKKNLQHHSNSAYVIRLVSYKGMFDSHLGSIADLSTKFSSVLDQQRKIVI